MQFSYPWTSKEVWGNYFFPPQRALNWVETRAVAWELLLCFTGLFLNSGNLIIPNFFPNESGKIWWSPSPCGAPVAVVILDGVGRAGDAFAIQIWKISGFEDANLCRKCRLSVEHFVSLRKTSTKKAKCGVFVFLSRNIYRFSDGWWGMGGFPSSSQIFGMGLGSSLCPRSLSAAPQWCFGVKELNLSKLSSDGSKTWPGGF